MLGGLAPGVTVTVRSVAPPASRLLGEPDPTPVGGVGAVTVNEIDALPLRPWVSVTDTGRLLLPALVPADTVAWNENTLSPAVTSPFVPLSKNCCVVNPPIAERLPVTGGTCAAPRWCRRAIAVSRESKCPPVRCSVMLIR